MVRQKRSTAPPPLPKASDVNPYMVERKAALMRVKKKAADVWENLGCTPRLSIATVREVINGTFRNDDVIEAFCIVTGLSRAAMFPATELEWIALHRKAERSVIEAVG